MVSFMPQSFYRWGNMSQYPSKTRPARPQIRYGHWTSSSQLIVTTLHYPGSAETVLTFLSM